MKKAILLISFCLLALPIEAQPIFDAEMQSLISLVKILQNAGKEEYDQVEKQLLADPRWTPMDETDPLREGECIPADRVPKCGLNKIFNSVAQARQGVHSHGDMLNGEDSRFDFSLIERSVKAKGKVSYTLQKRQGHQVFVILPYAGAAADLHASFSLNGSTPIPFETTSEGLLVYFSDGPVSIDDTITVSITGGATNQSFVLLNHNTRR